MKNPEDHLAKAESEQEQLTLNIDDITDEELSDMCDFLQRDDLAKYEDVIILHRDKKFKEAEIVVMFKDELFICNNKKDKVNIHNETLGIDSDLKIEWEERTSIMKNQIIAISISRPPICECPACNELRQKGEPPEQPEYYDLEFTTVNPKTFSVRIYDRDAAIGLQEHFRRWRWGVKPFKK